MTFDFIPGQHGLALNTSAVSGVEFVRNELKHYLEQYTLIDDCIAGEQRIKEKKTKYLTLPGDVTKEGYTARYENYITRAVFYGVSGRTLEALVGKVFTRDAIVQAPGLLKLLIDDANGEGISLDQLAQKAVATVVAKGRAGIHIDYPKVQGGASAADLQSGKIKPAIKLYQPQQITNWRKTSIGGREVLTLVVLQELYTIADDGFASKQAVQYRVLRLNKGVYTTELWRQPQGTSRGFDVAEAESVPVDHTGKPYNEIPFRFIGPRESGSDIEKPPMYDLCSLNIAHYRNSADYEEACFITGQPTLWASGLTEDWVKDVLDGTVGMGSRGVLALPPEGQAGLLQAAPNIMPMEAMTHKERQMVALGAKIVEQKGVQRTATEATQDEEAESSVLSSVARNVSNCIKWAMQWAGYFVGVPEGSIDFQLNSDFDLAALSPDERRVLLEEFAQGGIAFSEYRENMRKAGIATLTDEQALAEYEKHKTTFAPETDPNIDPNTGQPFDEGEDDDE